MRSFVSSGDAQLYIKHDDTLWGVGSNHQGLLGDGTGIDRPEPVHIQSGVAEVRLHGGRVYALHTDRTLWVWGLGLFEPMRIAGGVVRILGTGADRVAYITGAGMAYVFDIADGTAARLLEEPVLDILPDITYAAASADILYVNADRVLKRGGEEIARDAARIFAIDGHTFIIKTDGSLWGFGANNYGQLGDGTRVPRGEPVRIADGVVSVHSRAFLRYDGSFWQWSEDYPVPERAANHVVYVLDGRHLHFANGWVLTNMHLLYGRSEFVNVRLPAQALGRV